VPAAHWLSKISHALFTHEENFFRGFSNAIKQERQAGNSGMGSAKSLSKTTQKTSEKNVAASRNSAALGYSLGNYMGNLGLTTSRSESGKEKGMLSFQAVHILPSLERKYVNFACLK